VLVHVGEQPLHGPFVEDVAHFHVFHDRPGIKHFLQVAPAGIIYNYDLLDIQTAMIDRSVGGLR
jgi:hypothetical protein